MSGTSNLYNGEGMFAIPGAAKDEVVVVVADREAGSLVPGKNRCSVSLVSLTIRGGIVVSVEKWALTGPVLGQPASGDEATAETESASGPKTPTSWRACSELLLDADGSLYMASAHNGGEDGPFESIVSRVGTMAGGGFIPAQNIATVAVPMQKAEGLALYKDRNGRSMLLVASDNERSGGTVLLVEKPGKGALPDESY